MGKWDIPARREITDTELRFNPYHDPQNGRFTTAGGGSGGGYLYSKGGKSAYVVPKERFQNSADDDMYEMAKYKAAKSGAIYLEYTESNGKTKRYAAADRPLSRNWRDVNNIPENAKGVYKETFSQKQIDYTKMDTDVLETMKKSHQEVVNDTLWTFNMKVSDSKMGTKIKRMSNSSAEINYISAALAFKSGKTKAFSSKA